MIWCISLYKKVQERLDKVLGYTRETLTGVRVIRAFSKEENEINNFEGLNEELTKMQKHVGRISSLMNPITYVIINLAIIALIYTGAIRVGTGIITQGAVVALYNYMAQILVELIKLANLIINITKSIACGNRIQAVLELNTNYEQTNKVTEKIKSNAIVEFKNVTLRYKNAGEYSLSDISFRVKRGETIGIIGGTGSGKSSFVNMIPRFYDATSGEVLVDGVNVKDYAVEQLRNKIAVVPQKAVLFKGTVRENIRWGKKDSSDEEIYEALTISQAKELVEAKGGLDFEIEPGGRNLSGGQKQRLTIARALIKKPEILILDDSSSALDYATDAALRNSIREMQHTPTVFVVSQRTSSIQYADKIIVLEDGIIVGMGKHEELMQSCQIYHEIYDSQFKKERA
jgi:ABC-type multidrug transport system fused ATPase/permease subunit